jgi:hypothetical protein
MPQGWLLLTGGNSQAENQLQGYGNQDRIAASAQNLCLLFPIGAFYREVQPSYLAIRRTGVTASASGRVL